MTFYKNPTYYKLGFSECSLSPHCQLLNEIGQQYDPWIKLLRGAFVPRYANPVVKYVFRLCGVHPTRQSLNYAVALLQTGEPSLVARAADIVSQVLSLQDRTPGSKQQGNWPKYWEEAVSGIARPDPNWADFLGTYLLQVVLEYREVLSDSLLARLDAAVIEAARAIQRRNVNCEYSNIALRGAYVTLVAGEVYQIPDLQAYAVGKLGDLYVNTMRYRCFEEYNTPAYYVSMLFVLRRFQLHAKDRQVKAWADALYRFVWEEIACYFHAGTRQWAGPHSRSYSTLLKPEIVAMIDRSTTDRVTFGLKSQYVALEEAYLELACPVDLEDAFVTVQKPFTRVKRVFQEGSPRVLTTYMSPALTLGTVSYSDMWHQRQVLLAYWGTPQNSRYLRLRFLLDGDDYAPAHFVSVQVEEKVLGGVSFATDVDFRNPYAEDKAKYAVVGRDVRLRFEFGGSVKPDMSQTLVNEKLARVWVDGVWVQVEMVFAQFGEWAGEWRFGDEEGVAFLDWVFIAGRRCKIDLAKMKIAGLGFVAQVGTEPLRKSAVSSVINNTKLEIRSSSLYLACEICPMPKHELKNALVNQHETEACEV